MTPQLDPDRERKIRRNYADTDPNGTVRTLLDEIDRQRAALTEMTHCRDNALRALQRDDIDTDPHLPDLFADGLHGLYEWEDQPQPDQAPQALVDRCVQIVQPAFGKLAQQLAEARATVPPTDGGARRALTFSEYNSAWHAVEGAAGEEGADPGTVLHAVLDRLGIAWRDAARPAGVEPAPTAEELADATDPTLLRWGPDDVEYGDDDTITVMLSDLARKPYWLELDQELAAVLRANLVGPDGEQPGPDTLPAWLYRRFAGGVPAWEWLDDGDRTYWEHQAAAVRRAVERGGFKTPAPAAVPAAETGR